MNDIKTTLNAVATSAINFAATVSDDWQAFKKSALYAPICDLVTTSVNSLAPSNEINSIVDIAGAVVAMLDRVAALHPNIKTR